ncbi:MAG: hypothetical protein ACK5W1_03850 [Flavobacteriales bacterium]
MKTHLIAFALILGFTVPCCAQSPADSITMQKGFLGGYNFIYRGEILKVRQVVNVMDLNETAQKQMRLAKVNNDIANVLSVAGGFMVGWTLGDLASAEDPNYTVMAVGGGLIVAAIPFSVSAVKKSNQAVDTWNSGLRTSSLPVKSELRFGMTSTGLGLTFRF